MLLLLVLVLVLVMLFAIAANIYSVHALENMHIVYVF